MTIIIIGAGIGGLCLAQLLKKNGLDVQESLPEKLFELFELTSTNPFPKTRNPKLFTIRSIDQVADQGVLPTSGELIRYHIVLVKAKILHDDIGGMGTLDQLKEINDYMSESYVLFGE